MTVTFKHRDCYTRSGLRKRWYLSKKDAKRAARMARQRGHKLEVYRCRFCDLWHLGHARTRATTAA